MTTDSNDVKYSRIWKSMEHCVDVCIFSTFRNVTEMLHGGNWKVVHERCKYIIEKHMKELHIDDPHEFDKAVCWRAVSTGKDRDPAWRCVCAFFFAAAMELVMVRKLNDEKFKRVGESCLRRGSEGKASEVDDLKQQIKDLLKEIQTSHGDIHSKLDKIKGTQIVATAQVHNHIHPSTAQSPDDFFKRIVDMIKTKGYQGGDADRP